VRRRRFGFGLVAALFAGAAPAAVASCSSSSNPGALGVTQGGQNDASIVDSTIPDSAKDSAQTMETGEPQDASEAGEGPECGAGLIACNGVACVDLESNPNNCGTCFNVCTGSGMTISCCDAACVDNTSDPKNCGSCGVVCEAGTTCVANVCQ